MLSRIHQEAVCAEHMGLQQRRALAISLVHLPTTSSHLWPTKVLSTQPEDAEEACQPLWVCLYDTLNA